MKLAPNDARFYLAYAQHLGAAKKTDEAIAKLKQAQRVAGDDPAMLGTIGFEFKTAPRRARVHRRLRQGDRR